MSLYEGMFLMDNRQANRDWEGSLDSLKSIITKNGGEIVRCEKWGERKLAYEIKGRRRGTYVLTYFNGESDVARDITRDCYLTDLILRVLILKVAALPPVEEPQAKVVAATAKPAVAPVEAATEVVTETAPAETAAPEQEEATPAAEVPATAEPAPVAEDSPEADAAKKKEEADDA